MKCSICNNNIKSGQEVCLKCGHILRYESEEQTKRCIHCNRPIPISYKKCPYCKKSQKSKKKKVLSFLFIIIVILINYHYISCFCEINDIFKEKDSKYHSNISYEELVRKNVYYDESLIILTGKVISIENISNLTNTIKIKMYIENDKDKVVEIKYMNRQKLGILKNDEIVVYGKYKKLKGNIPEINAQKIKMN